MRISDTLQTEPSIVDGSNYGAAVIPSLGCDTGSSEGNVRYEPYIGGNGEIGFRATHEDGRVRFIYLNPSDNPDGSDVPNVFVYVGECGGASDDTPYVHFCLFAEE